MDPILAAIALAVAGYMAGSVKVVQQGTEGLVERWGRFHRRLEPGINFVIPVMDSVLVESMREQVLDIEPHQATTNDNVPIQVDAVMYWRILDVERAYYSVEDLEAALRNLVITTLRAEVGRLSLTETFSSRDKVNKALQSQLDEATETWGVKITRVEIQEVKMSEKMQQSLELERLAETKKRAEIAESEGTVKSIEMMAKALESHPNAKMVMQYLLTQRYVDANQKLGESNNSKIIFMDPKSLSETIGELIGADTTEGLGPRMGNSDPA
jgi:regulator of protease activity HflC (stomatin/prohibitin superfamily)